MTKSQLEELEELNQQIQKANEDSISLRNEVIEKTRNLIEQNIKFLEAKTKRNASLFEQQSFIQYSTNDLPQDYIDHITEKQDQINKLIRDNEDSENELDKRLKEIDTIIQEQSDLMIELTQLHNELYQQTIENIPLKKKSKLYRREIKEYDILIREAEQIRKKTEESLSKAIQITDPDTFVDGGIIDLQNAIANIKDQINVVEHSLDENLQRLNKYQDDEFDEQLKFDQNMNKLKNLYSWDNQKDQLNNELKSMQKSIAENKSIYNTKKQEIEEKENMLSVILPLAKKYSKAKVVQTYVDPQETFNSLSKKLNTISKTIKKNVSSRNDMLTVLHKKNDELEKKIELRDREYQHMLAKLSCDCQILKNKINTARKNNGQKEHQIVETIKSLRIKKQSKEKVKMIEITPISKPKARNQFNTDSSKKLKSNPAYNISPGFKPRSFLGIHESPTEAI